MVIYPLKKIRCVKGSGVDGGAYQKPQVRAWGPEGKSEPATKFSKLGKTGVSTSPLGVFLCSSGLLAQEDLSMGIELV